MQQGILRSGGINVTYFMRLKPNGGVVFPSGWLKPTVKEIVGFAEVCLYPASEFEITN